ncbi:MAG: hypothetical protein HYY17_15015 [Planctomycetes bacterium]|nr:hypothetical protein [Planctomycetota bacterium]
MKRNSGRRLALGAVCLGLLGLGSCLVVRAILARKIPPPATDVTGTGKLPLVVLSVRGRVEVLDPGTQQWTRIRPGMVLEEGMIVNVGQDGGVTVFSSGAFSLSASEKSVFAIDRLRRRGEHLDVALGLRSGRLAARTSSDVSLAVSTDFGTYTVDGSAAIGTGVHSDDVVVGSGSVLADSGDGSTRRLGSGSRVRLGMGRDGDMQETALSGSTEGGQALAVHLNTVGDTTGEAAGRPIDFEAERRRIEDLIYWGLEKLRGRQFDQLIGHLAGNFTLQGMPTTPGAFGTVVTNFDTVHQVLTTTPVGEPSVTIAGGTTTSTTTASTTTTTTTTSPPPDTSTAGGTTSSSSGGTGGDSGSGGTTTPSGDTGGGTGTPTSGTAATSQDLTATATVTAGVLATEQEPPPPTPEPQPEPQPEPPPTCVLSGTVQYVFTLQYVNGTWQIVSLEVIANP